MHVLLASLGDDHDGRMVATDLAAVRGQIEAIVRIAVFGEAADSKAARALIQDAAPRLGAVPSSIAPLYAARGRGEAGGFTVPAVNIRGMSWDTSRALFRAIQATEATATVFELARAEMAFSGQECAELAAVVLGAAIAEGYVGPVFLQGDHYQANAKRYAADPDAETRALEALIRGAIAARFYNIDIDASTLVDLSQATVRRQQAPNARLTAHLAKLVRAIEPAGVRVSIGGEIGEVGANNSTVEELEAYIDQFHELVGPSFAGGLAKVSVQTGTSHGGVPLADGSVAEVALDFETLRELSRVARERYGMAGAVQHGASTLPDELFGRFPEAETAEVHLATGFQNLLLDHPAFPAPLLDEIRGFCHRELGGEREAGETDAQFFYRTRKKAWGPFKRQVWDIPEEARAEMGAALQAKFEFLMRRLKADGTKELVGRYIAV